MIKEPIDKILWSDPEENGSLHKRLNDQLNTKLERGRLHEVLKQFFIL
jgi:hypothetical protein